MSFYFLFFFKVFRSCRPITRLFFSSVSQHELHAGQPFLVRQQTLHPDVPTVRRRGQLRRRLGRERPERLRHDAQHQAVRPLHRVHLRQPGVREQVQVV